MESLNFDGLSFRVSMWLSFSFFSFFLFLLLLFLSSFSFAICQVSDPVARQGLSWNLGAVVPSYSDVFVLVFRGAQESLCITITRINYRLITTVECLGGWSLYVNPLYHQILTRAL